MIVAVGSTNPVKIEAVKLACKRVLPEKSWTVQGVDVPSHVSKQPMSDSEAIRGGRNRAAAALKKLGADYGIGIEGGLQKVGRHWFDCGWAVIIDKAGREGIGSSLRMMTPTKMMRLIKQGKELGEANDIVFGRKNSKQAEGHFGLMTKGAVTRTSGYVDGIIAALVRFLHPKLFD